MGDRKGVGKPNKSRKISRYANKLKENKQTKPSTYQKPKQPNKTPKQPNNKTTKSMLFLWL